MTVFDPGERTETEPRGDGEPLYTFLDRSARPRPEAMRQMLEEWFVHFPAPGQADLRGRLRSTDNRQHLGAFFELYLFTLFSALDFEVELHPRLPSTTKTPDFKVSHGATVFYLEATLAAPSDAETAAKRRENRVYDTINRLDSPNFFVGVEVSGQPNSDPPGAQIRDVLTRWLDTLDPDEVAADVERSGLDTSPKMRFEHEEWKIVFSAIPKSHASRGKGGLKPIAVTMFGPVTVDTRKAIVHALEDKAGRYGTLDRPYVIALDIVEAPYYHEDELMDALFGQDTILGRRLPNGVWMGPKGPRNRKVSAVLAIHDIYADVAQRTPVMWHHPWARKPLPIAAWPFEHRIPNMETRRYQVRKARKRIDQVLILPGDHENAP